MKRTLLLLGSFGLGAGLMYMLDPERGERRRARARTQVQTYRHWRNDLLPSWRSPGHTMRRLGHHTRAALARTHIPLIYEQDWRALRPARGGPMGVGKGFVMLGGLGVGLGLMYMFDPNSGSRRRALLRDKARSYWYSTGNVISKKVRDTQNRARGRLMETRQWFSRTEAPSDAVLEGHVRAQIGHVISQAGAIGVTAHQGRVSLSGPVPANEAEKLLATVASVPGVREVVDQLEVHTETTHISGLQGGNTTR
jgi:osmotically-inducible protein OsmY